MRNFKVAIYNEIYKLCPSLDLNLCSKLERFWKIKLKLASLPRVNQNCNQFLQQQTTEGYNTVQWSNAL